MVTSPTGHGPAEAAIQVDDRHNEAEAAAEDDGYQSDGDSTASLRSAITKYVYENGRRYHNARFGAYWGPNDDVAQDNLDLFHHIFNLSLGGRLFLAPIAESPQNVLDLGTGTGIWALEFADAYPSASVIATDLSPIQPLFVPPNLSFQIDNMEDEWTFRQDHFDFIHARCVYGSVADYPALYRQALKHLKPGAWFEQAEISVTAQSEDGTTAGTKLEEWGPLAVKAGVVFGRSFSIAEDMKGLMEEAGFVNVTCKAFRWPIGSWPRDPDLKQIGIYNRLGWDEGLEGWAMFLFTNHLGVSSFTASDHIQISKARKLTRNGTQWQPEEVQVLLAKLRREIRDNKIHSYQYMFVSSIYFHGQKY